MRRSDGAPIPHLARKPERAAPLPDDEGSTLPLVIGLLALCLAVVLVAVAASSLVLARMRLLSLADGAALAGSEAFELADIRVDEGALRVELTDDAVAQAAADYLAATPLDGLEDVALVSAGTSDGRSAVVTVEATWRPPLPIWLVADELRFSATSTARVVFERRRIRAGPPARGGAGIRARSCGSAPCAPR